MLDITEEIIQAAALYKAALKENKAELIFPLKDFNIVYVPHMPHSHRTIWIEANLILLYRSSEELASDYLPVSNLQNGARRGLYINVINEDYDIEYHITNMACSNLKQTYSRSLGQKYIEIEPEILLRVINLLSFA